jgi:hypothetical protein
LSSSDSSEDKPKPTKKTEVAKHKSGHITRVCSIKVVNLKYLKYFIKILSTSADIPYKQNGHYDSACARCALRKISSTLLLEGVTLKEVSSRVCGRFPQNLKYTLAAEIRKYQRIGLKSIEIVTIATDAKQNLIIDFDIIVDPQHNEAIRNALRHAIVSLDVSSIIPNIPNQSCFLFCLASTCV